ncbi:hypothetical protein RB195_024268 [Necator americanus]|uniref:Reverse transcriptase domain-containing protein n=1 Tax=Necator americanus TaxID=51031 RepID=A0ABR1EMN5_NECAM
MNQGTTAAVRTPTGCTTPFEVVTGVRQGAVAEPFLLNFATDEMRHDINMSYSKPITFTQETKYLIRKPRAVSDVAFESDHTPVLLSLITWFQKGSRGVSYQPKLNMARLKDVEYRMKFGQLTSIDIDSTAEMEER